MSTLEGPRGMEITDEQLSRLPKWAQEHIARLTNQVESLLKENAAHTEGPGDSDTILEPYAKMLRTGAQPKPLKRGSEIEFRLQPNGFGQHLRVKLVDTKHGRALQVLGERNMILDPTSSNTFLIYADPDRL